MNKIQLRFQKIRTFMKDHFHLLFKSAAENHLRIQAIKKELKDQRRSQIAGGVCNLQFQSYSQLKRYQKKVRLLTYSFSSTFTSLIVALIVVQLFFGAGKSQGATFGWLQNNWSGGADTVATANHSSNQNGWTKFFSKDANVAVSASSATLSATSNAWTDTSDGDFNAGSKTNTFVVSNSVKLLKPNGATCAVDGDCAENWCSTGICTTPWIAGPCGTTNLKVFKADVAGTSQWKTTNDSCVGPQCSGGILVADNTVNFSAYPARNACKTLGGRLPSVAELQCIYTNKTSYTGAFQSSYYWSSAEGSATIAWYVYFFNGTSNTNGKATSGYVRCVQGQ